MRLDLQAKLLRVIQEQEFERVGGSQTIRVDVRLIATTNRHLESLVEAGRFREDLFYRLNVVPIHIPPLRERPEDIPLLLRHFLKQAAREFDAEPTEVTPEAMELLQQYTWPGNVRELPNVVERAVILSRGRPLAPQDFGRRVVQAVRDAAAGRDGTSSAPADLPLDLRELERIAIGRALEATGGHRARAAKLLGISERTLRNKLNRDQS